MFKTVYATGKIEDLRYVKVYWINESSTTHLFHKDDVATFVQATIKLHHNPGLNPYTGRLTAKAVKITCSLLSLSGPYWWTNDDLYADGRGVKFIEASFEEEILWQDSAFLEEAHRKEIEAERRAELGY